MPQLLSLFVSDYSRWRILQFYKQNFRDNDNDDHKINSPSNQTKTTTDIWGKKSNIIKKIVNADVNSGIQSLDKTITSAVETLSKRFSPMMRFQVQDENKIDDSLGWFATYIIHGIALIKNDTWKPPCQVFIH